MKSSAATRICTLNAGMKSRRNHVCMLAVSAYVSFSRSYMVCMPEGVQVYPLSVCCSVGLSVYLPVNKFSDACAAPPKQNRWGASWWRPSTGFFICRRSCNSIEARPEPCTSSGYSLHLSGCSFASNTCWFFNDISFRFPWHRSLFMAAICSFV